MDKSAHAQQEYDPLGLALGAAAGMLTLAATRTHCDSGLSMCFDEGMNGCRPCSLRSARSSSSSLKT